jgi:HEAT repeat protein
MSAASLLHGWSGIRLIEHDKGMRPSTWNGHTIPRSAHVAELASMLQEAPPACWIAFRALSERDDAAAIALLVAETESRDPLRRRAAVEAIGDSPVGKMGVSQLRHMFSDASPIVVRSAAEAARKLRDAASHDPIVGLLRRGDASMRQEALRTLDELWRGGDLERVLVVARQDADDATRRQASFVLKNHASPAEWRLLLDLWQRSVVPRERVWACELIRDFGVKEDGPLAEPFLIDSNGHVRRAAKSALEVVNARTTS